ncbi:MAG TPA: hypothetical protein HPQ04_10620 [Rhodospirillaceae bacterium]|nr:hypothetical protein [Rhodospirillaceae bacterium]
MTSVLATLVIAGALAACAATGKPAVAGMPTHQDEPAAWDPEVRDDLLTEAAEASRLAAKARSGINPSEMTVGWFVSGVLNALAGVDEGLETYFGGNVMGFLRNRMAAQPAVEVQAVSAMAAGGGPAAPVRRAAGWALESLRHIPDAGEPPEVQLRDRNDLASALESLSSALKDAAISHQR